MDNNEEKLRNWLMQLCREWIDQGLPTREALMQAAGELEEWKSWNGVQGLWIPPPRMVTATLDDGMGHGLALVERYARIMGLAVHSLGLLVPSDKIITHCLETEPEFLGLTVLQSDSDEDLCHIGQNLPPNCCLIAGGAAFHYDPDLAGRCKVEFVAANVARFIRFIMSGFDCNLQKVTIKQPIDRIHHKP